MVSNSLDTLLLMSEFLEKRGIHVVGNSTEGIDAYEMYKAHHPDIMIIDSDFSQMDRTYAYTLVKSEFPNAKIILILNHFHEELDKRKCCDILIKPYKIDDLVLKINFHYKHDELMTSKNVFGMDKILLELGFDPITNSEEEVFDFIHHVPKNYHPKLFFQTETFRDAILKEYFNPRFNPDASSGFFGREKPSVKTTNFIKYRELVDNNQILFNKVESFFQDTIATSNSENQTRFACEDTVWFKDHGLFTLHQTMSKQLNPSILEKSSIFCCYDITRLNEEYIRIILKKSNIAIIEKPFRVFKKTLREGEGD